MDVIECSARSSGHFPLKKEQREVVDMFLKGNDVLCVSQQGLGKNRSKSF